MAKTSRKTAPTLPAKTGISPLAGRRRAAFEWMEGRGFFNDGGYAIGLGNVFFESTREEKLARIRSLNLDRFIDDLVEVLENPDFPEGLERHRYAANWPRIMGGVFGDAV